MKETRMAVLQIHADRAFATVRECPMARILVCAAFVLCSPSTPAYAQASRPGPAAVANVSYTRVPSQLRPQLEKLGDRFTETGKERLALSGTITDADQTQSPVEVIYELPNKIRIQRLGARAAVLTFDGNSSRSSAGELDESQEDILESLQADSLDGFFGALSNGAAFRVVGRGFRPSQERFPDYRGPSYDIYQLIAPVKPRGNQEVRSKRFYFDSSAHVLLRVLYKEEALPSGRSPAGGSGKSIETVFSKWGFVEGQLVPGRVERLEDGEPVFTLDITATSFTARSDDGLFAPAAP